MVNDIKRLHELTFWDIYQWQEARMNEGQKRYGDRDTKRYNLVDVMEELLDAMNILDRFKNRAKLQGYDLASEHSKIFAIQTDIFRAMQRISNLDKSLPSDICTDENGGARIWWSNSKE
jgi:hypothetical protein